MKTFLGLERVGRREYATPDGLRLKWEHDAGRDGRGVWMLYGSDGRPCDAFDKLAEAKAWAVARVVPNQPLIEVLA